MPRRARLDAPGTLHHVMVRGIEKRRIVNDVTDRKNFVKRLGELSAITKTAIYAWALMTNHAHILLRSSETGLASFMRRFLTGYAISYNRRHRRWGHLFQNRYKSIVCDEDAYFTELVRYIHLNPLRAKLVKSLTQLDRYRWCGHGVLMGKIQNEWQDRDYVLKWFGKIESEAKKNYRNYVKKGIEEGRYPLYRYAYYADIPDPEDFLPDLVETGGAHNFTSFSDPELDSILKRARTETNPAKRMGIYREAEKRVLDTPPFIPVVYLTTQVVFQKNILNVELPATGTPYLPLHRITLAENP